MDPQELPKDPHSLWEDAMAMLVGTLFVALGVTLYTQATLLTGSTAGMAFLLQYASGWPFGVWFFLINLPFYWLAIRRMGWSFTLRTFAAIGLVSLFSELTGRWIDIAALVRKPMLEIYPHLRDVRIDYAWGGTLAITVKRMPYLARLGSNILSASGYSGHGVGSATHAGQLCALAIQGETSGFDVFAQLPTPAFPGGAAARSPLLLLAMTWFGLRDRLGI